LQQQAEMAAIVGTEKDTQSYRNGLESRQKTVRDNAEAEERRRVSESVEASQTGVLSAGLRGIGMNWQAQQLEIRQQQSMQLRMTENPLERLALSVQFAAQNETANKLYGFGLANQGIGLSAQQQANAYHMNYEDIAGQAVQAGASSLLAVRNADPMMREEVRKTELSNLESKRFDLLTWHSGGYAAKGSGTYIPGDPLNLTHQVEARAHAKKELANAVAKVKGEQGLGKDPGLLATAANWVGHLLGAGVHDDKAGGGSRAVTDELKIANKLLEGIFHRAMGFVQN
jgi:hypothetical protein